MRQTGQHLHQGGIDRLPLSVVQRLHREYALLGGGEHGAAAAGTAPRYPPPVLQHRGGVVRKAREEHHRPLALHLLLSEVAGNRVVTRLMRAIQRPLMEQLRRSIAHLKATGQLADNLATHERIVDGIERGDGAGAQRGFDDMLAISLAFGAVGEGEPGGPPESQAVS